MALLVRSKSLRFAVVLSVLGGSGAPAAASAQSSKLLDALRVHASDAQTLAASELAACKESKCPELSRLSLTSAALELSEGNASGAESLLTTVGAPPLLAAYHAYYLGQAQFYSGRYKKAAETFERAAGLAPQPTLQTRCKAREGEAWLAAGKAQQALPLLDDAVKDIGGPELLFGRARARQLTNDVNGARQDYKDVLVRFALHPLSSSAIDRLKQLPGPRQSLGLEERLARVRQFLDGQVPAAADAELDSIEKDHLAGNAMTRVHVNIERALVRYGQGKDAEGDALLLQAAKGPAPLAAQALLFRAKHHLKVMNRGNEDRSQVQQWMVELDKKFPREPAAEEAGFYAGWLQLQDNKFVDAARLLAVFEQRHPHSRKRDDAIWFRGLAQLRAQQYGDARATFDALAKAYARSPLVAQARYWSVRSRQLGGDNAVDEGYQNVISLYPGSFYALLAAERLRELGKTPAPAFPNPPKLGSPKPPRDLALATALVQTGLIHDASEEMGRLAAGIHGRDPALLLGQALSQLGEPGYAYGLAARLLWGEAYGERKPEALALLYPRAFAGNVEAEAKAQGLSPFLLWALMRRESAFHPFQLSAANARGLMQLIPKTAASIAGELHTPAPDPDSLFAPEVNLHYSAWYVSQLVKRFVHPAFCAAAYNAGPAAVARWAEANGTLPVDLFVETIPYKETRAYVKQVTADFYTYQAFYGAGPETARLAMTLPTPSPEGINF